MPELLLHPQNRLLAALPSCVREQLASDIKMVYLPQGRVLHDGGRAVSTVTLSTVYFPIDAVVSLTRLTENGASAEVAQIGSEGLIGISDLIAVDSSQTVATVQGAGRSYALSGQRLRNVLFPNPAVLMMLLHYTQRLILQTAQLAVCNRHHSIEQQVSRWLLRFDDHGPGRRLVITHEQIAEMLGVRRGSVSLAMHKLQKLKTIHCRRGAITVLDRSELERLSCECYGAVWGETKRLLPPLASSVRWHRQSASDRSYALADNR